MQGVDAWVRVPRREDRSNTACTQRIRIPAEYECLTYRHWCRFLARRQLEADIMHCVLNLECLNFAV